MVHSPKSFVATVRMVFITLLLLTPFTAQAALDNTLDWPNFYDPEVIHGLHFKIKDTDWDTIRADETYDIEVPILFWTAQEGEAEAVLVAIRRKSATPIGDKVSFKVDINDYKNEDLGVSKWHGLKKLSLENGDDQDVVREGLAWYLHRLATSPSSQVYPVAHTPGLANWVTLTAHVVPACTTVEEVETCQGALEFEGGETIEPQGVYVSVEQPGKQFLDNRNIWNKDQTWLYKQDDIGKPERKEVGCEGFDAEGDSPTVQILQCAPFKTVSGKGKNKVTPADCDVSDMNALINMDIMLAQAAVEAFSSSGDGMFTHIKNFYWSDRSEAECNAPLENTKRLHFPWDLDAAIASDDANVYGVWRKKRGKTILAQTEFQRVILGEQSFRDIYNEKLQVIVGQAYIDAAIGYLERMETDLTPLLEADPNNKMGGDVAGHFGGLRDWLNSRAANVSDQICLDDNFCD